MSAQSESVEANEPIIEPSASSLELYWKDDYIASLYKIETRCSGPHTCVCTEPCNIRFPPHWQDVRSNEDLSDGLVHCYDGTTFKISRLLLAAVSPYFKVLFTNKMNPTQSDVTDASVDAPGSIFSKMLDYAYTGQCTINESTLKPLMQYADQYDVMGIMRLCSQFSLDSINAKNCIGILGNARRYFCAHIQERCMDFVHLHFMDVLSESKEIGDLPAGLLTKLLVDDRLVVRSEQNVFEAVQKWLLHNNDQSRMPHLTTLVSCVRLGLLKPSDLLNMSEWPPIAGDQECQKLIRSVRPLLNDPKNVLQIIQNPHRRPRNPIDLIFLIGGAGYANTTDVIETYDNNANRWLVYSRHLIRRKYHGVCTLDGIIYVIGGRVNATHLSTTLAFDPVTHSVRNCSCMNSSRSSLAVVTHAGKIYAIGGENMNERIEIMPISTVERYDPKTDQWDYVESMLTPRALASAACVNNKIYIVGGHTSQAFLSSCEVYDPVLNTWSFGPSMSTARSAPSLVQCDGVLYALGGVRNLTALATAERLTPGIVNAWSPIQSMIYPRQSFAAVVLDRRIIVIGGVNSYHLIDFVESYNIEDNSWSKLQPISVKRAGGSACVVSGLKNRRDYSLVGNEEYRTKREVNK